MTLRIALLGVEHGHAHFWAAALQQRADVTVAGMWDADPARAAAFAARHGIAHVSGRAALLAACDAVAIASATADHLALIDAAAAAGRPVLCEKPLGIDAARCAAIAAVVRTGGIPFMQSFPKRFDPVNHEIAALLKQSALGRVTLCRVRHGHAHGLDPAFRAGWYTDPLRSGGGTLLDEGIHAADFLRWMFGDPVAVTATTSSAALGLAVEDTAVATFRYAGGMIAEVATGWCFAAADTSIEIYGTQGTILLSGVDLASRPTRDSGFLRVFTQGTWRDSPTVPHFRTGIFHERVAWAFADALTSGGPMPVTLADGLGAAAMIEAAYRAARTGISQPVTPIPEEG